MKLIVVKIFIVLSIFIFNFFSNVYAQESKSTESASTNSEAVEKIKQIAENVVEDSKQTKAHSGRIIQIKDEEIVIEDIDGKKLRVSIFITEYFQVGSKISEIKKESLKIGDYIFVTGPEVGGVVTANSIFKDTNYFFLSGKIATINKSDFNLEIITLDKRRVTVDVESYTKQNSMNIKSLKVEKTGFSKLKEGDSLHVVVKGLNKNSDKVSAIRYLIIPNEFFLQ